MNPEDYSRDDLLREAPPALLAAGLVALAVLWLATHLARRRWPAGRPIFIAAGFLAISGVFWLAFQIAGAFLSLATSWSLLLIALVAGFAWELILWIYTFERELVAPARGRLLLALRLAALVTLIVILLQPVRSFLEDREIDREIAVLLDDSQSMHLSDQRLSVSERLDRAQLFGADFVKRGRPSLRDAGTAAAALDEILSREIGAIAAAPSPEAGLDSRGQRLPERLTETEERNSRLGDLLERARDASPTMQDREELSRLLYLSREAIAEHLREASRSAAASDARTFLSALESARDSVRQIGQPLGAVTQSLDEAFFASLSTPEQEEVERLASASRHQIALQAATGVTGFGDATGNSSPLMDSLAERYNLRYYRFHRTIEEIPSLDAEAPAAPRLTSVRAQTDLAGAVEHILRNTSPESLAGILLLTDGRHNAAALPEDSLRQLAIQNSPLCPVPIGSDLGPIDISLLSVNAPESIYLDDRVVVRASARVDGMLGKTLHARLLSGGEVVDEQSVEIGDVSFRGEIRFVHQPEKRGIFDYRVELEPDPRELFRENNHWDFKLAVTDDRTNVLLVDGHPRWEFRYLRNLFYGRDKSVHLQYVLLDPDTISGFPAPPSVPASSTRKFGDAEATLLPRGQEEWQLFDVIILGDIRPDQLSSGDWWAIREAVTRRGALLVCVAGPRHMPHGYGNPVLRELLPVIYQQEDGGQFESPEESYQVELTAVGKTHPVMAQSSSRSLNQEIWADFPPLRWRWKSHSVKPGAEVLAFARPSGTPGGIDSPIGADPGSIEAAITRLARQKTLEAENALVTTNRSGLGKVVLMHFDRTWRFRYGVGDTYHHRFWGQLTRWGAGPNLRSGNERVRLGTDRLRYTPTDPIEITAKLLDRTRRPVTDAEIRASVFRGEDRIATQQLGYRSDSAGLYETTFAAFPDEGEYRIVLEGESVEEALRDDSSLTGVETELLVVAARNPVELAELTADRDFLHRAARITNGRVAELWELHTLADAFGAPRETLRERRNITLWDKWPFLALFLGCLTLEWVVRRTGGLV